jgi:hypothetical protein
MQDRRTKLLERVANAGIVLAIDDFANSHGFGKLPFGLGEILRRFSGQTRPVALNVSLFAIGSEFRFRYAPDL